MVDHYLMVKSPFGVSWPFYPGANEGGHSPFFMPALPYFLCLQWPHFLSYAPIFNCQHWPISHTLPTIRTSSNQPCVPHPIHLQSSPTLTYFSLIFQPYNHSPLWTDISLMLNHYKFINPPYISFQLSSQHPSHIDPAFLHFLALTFSPKNHFNHSYFYSYKPSNRINMMQMIPFCYDCFLFFNTSIPCHARSLPLCFVP